MAEALMMFMVGVIVNEVCYSRCNALAKYRMNSVGDMQSPWGRAYIGGEALSSTFTYFDGQHYIYQVFHHMELVHFQNSSQVFNDFVSVNCIKGFSHVHEKDLCRVIS